MKIKVMIVDDQVILSEGIRSVIASSGDIDVIAVAGGGQQALDLMADGKVPDVVLLDIRMPGMNGVVTTGEIKKRYPNVKVLILTTFDDSDYILSALNNGACGYLLKDIGAAALVVLFFLARYLAGKIVSPLEESYLSQRQFISDAGHELKTPVAVINANLELLSREIGGNQWLSNIQYENERMSALVIQLLELARAENVTPQMESLDLSRLVYGETLPFESVAYEKV